MKDEIYKELAQRLLELEPEEVCEILRLVFENWKDDEIDEKNGWKCQTRFFLGSAVRSINDEGAWNSWEISAISYPDKNEYDGGLGPFWNFCQESTCDSCGMEIRSNAKKSFCSVCGCANSLS